MTRNDKYAAGKPPASPVIAVLAALLASSAGIGAAQAADCPRPGVLGTSRILAVDPKIYPRSGSKSFPQSLPLHDHEVVLTFDDGPSPLTTPKVLAALANECVRATFFLIGEHSADHPDLVRRIAENGNTVGHHTWDHPSLPKIPMAEATDEINRGIAAEEKALHGVATTTPTTPFFRFPNFESSPALLDLLQSRDIAVFGADFWVSDWIRMTPEQEFKLLTGRLKRARKGVILMHDTKPWTAAMLPAFLRYLRENGYHVVHLVPDVAPAGEP
jgi:peptidoglycan/xylan/chitin deacetylase (PgdA/CDA1 family)